MKHAPLLLILALSACAGAPKIRNPQLQAAPPAAWAADTLAAAPGDTLWWTGFNDPRMDSLIAEALAHNLDLQIAATRIQAAAAQARIAGAPLYPQINAGFNAGRRKQIFVGLPIPDALGTPSSTSNSFGVSLDLSWEIDLWGRIGAGKAAALADFQAAQASLRGAQLSLTAQTIRLWLALLEAGRQVELARATVENYRTTVQQVRSRYEKGLRPSLDLRLTLADEASALDRLIQREQILDQTLRQFEILLGRYPAASLAVSGDLPGLPGPVPGGLPADLISRRPDLVAAERQLAGSYARLSQARKALYPRISLTASGGRTSDQLGDLLDGDFGVWNLVGNLVQPLFQGGRIKAGIDLAESQTEQSLARFAQQVLTAYGEVESALMAEQFLARREEATQVATDQALAARRLAEERYRRGLTDLITMLSAQRTAYLSESQHLTVRRLRLDARVNLRLALGGGFENREQILSSTHPMQGAPTQ